MKKRIIRLLFLTVLVSFSFNMLQMSALTCDEFGSEMEELFEFSEKGDAEAINLTEVNDELFFHELQLCVLMEGKFVVNAIASTSYPNPLIEIPDSPPKLSV